MRLQAILAMESGTSSTPGVKYVRMHREVIRPGPAIAILAPESSRVRTRALNWPTNRCSTRPMSLIGAGSRNWWSVLPLAL